jgi:hypothetical protein
MATYNPFLNIRTKVGDTDRSLEWYQAQVKALASAATRPNKLMQNVPDLTTRLIPGKMYMFFYDAKLKDKLPYWDQFPLVLPFRKVPGGFYGINLHYLPYAMRFKVLGALHQYATDEKLNEDTRVRVNWNILLNLSRVAPVKACVKHYLDEHVESRFLNIKYPDWVVASLLPVERFVGASKQDVWRHSREKY